MPAPTTPTECSDFTWQSFQEDGPQTQLRRAPAAVSSSELGAPGRPAGAGLARPSSRPLGVRAVSNLPSDDPGDPDGFVDLKGANRMG